MNTSATKLALALLLVVLVGLFIRNYIQTRNQLIQDNPVKLAAHIGEFLELPPDETPTLATVKDSSKLKGQALFKNAQDGDKVLIYSKAGRAVVYRPETKKVIEYVAVDLNSTPTK